MVYGIVWGIVGFAVFCNWFRHDVSDTDTRGRRAAINFSLACFEKPGEDWSDSYSEIVFTILVRLCYHRQEPRSFDFLTVGTQT